MQNWLERVATMEICPFKILLRTLVFPEKSHGPLLYYRIQPENYCPSKKKSKISKYRNACVEIRLNHILIYENLWALIFFFYLHRKKSHLARSVEGFEMIFMWYKLILSYLFLLSSLYYSLLCFHAGSFFLSLCLYHIYRAESRSCLKSTVLPLFCKKPKPSEDEISLVSWR